MGIVGHPTPTRLALILLIYLHIFLGPSVLLVNVGPRLDVYT